MLGVHAILQEEKETSPKVSVGLKGPSELPIHHKEHSFFSGRAGNLASKVPPFTSW